MPRGGPCPPQYLHSGGKTLLWPAQGAGVPAPSPWSIGIISFFVLKSVYNIYLYSVYIYIFIYIYRVYVHVLHRRLVATPGPALSMIAVPLLVALTCVVSGPDTILKVDKRVLHL